MGKRIQGHAAPVPSAAEVGRIRIGASKPGSGSRKQAVKLEGFRLTSEHRDYIEEQAERYEGSQAGSWDGGVGRQWDLRTNSRRLEIIVPRVVRLDQTLEARDARGKLIHLCDGIIDQQTYAPCTIGCSPRDGSKREIEAALRRRQAAGVKEVSRLSVQLPGLSGSGLWRFQSTGFLTAQKLLAAADEMPYHIGQRAELVLSTRKLGENFVPEVEMVFLEPAVDPRLAQILLEQQANAAYLHAKGAPPPKNQVDADDPFDMEDEDGEISEIEVEEAAEVPDVKTPVYVRGEQRTEILALRDKLFTKSATQGGKTKRVYDEAGWKDWLDAQWQIRDLSLATVEMGVEILAQLHELHGLDVDTETGEVRAPAHSPSASQIERYFELKEQSGLTEEKLAGAAKKRGANHFSQLTEDAAEEYLTFLQAFVNNQKTGAAA